MMRRNEKGNKATTSTPRKSESSDIDDEEDDEDLEWDVSQTTQTAWSTSAAAIQPARRPRRAFGSRQKNHTLQSMMKKSSSSSAKAPPPSSSSSDFSEPNRSSALDLNGLDHPSFLKPRRSASVTNTTAGFDGGLFSSSTVAPLPEEPLLAEQAEQAQQRPTRRKFQPIQRRAHTVPTSLLSTTAAAAAPASMVMQQQPAQPPPKPTRRRIARSHSLVLGGSTASAAAETMGQARRQLLCDSPAGLSPEKRSKSAGVNSSVWKTTLDDDENLGPNYTSRRLLRHPDNAEEEEVAFSESRLGGGGGGQSRVRRKIARRASIQCFSPSVASSASPGFSHFRSDNAVGLQQQKQSNNAPWIPPPRLFADSTTSPSKSTRMTSRSNGVGGASDALADLLSASSPPTSVSSSISRKRGVCGSPISDIDDWSTGGLSASMNSSSSLSVRRTSSNRSRSRLCLPPRDPATGAATRLNSSSSNSLQQRSSLHSSSSHSQTMGGVKTAPGDNDCRGMDIDSDDDDTASDDVDTSLQDMSFTSATGADTHSFPVVTIATTTTNDNNNKTHDEKKEEAHQETSGEDFIIESMSSWNDVKFLVNALRKENNSHKHIFGIVSNSWTVAPPIKWHTRRRAAFFQWLVHHLEFSVRPLGNSVNVLQIPKSKGMHLLQNLEKALMIHKQQELQSTMMVKQDDSEAHHGTFGSIDAGSNVIKHSAAGTLCQPPQRDSHRPLSHFESILKEDAEDLAAGLQSLTVHDKSARESDVSIPSSVASSNPLEAAMVQQLPDTSCRPSFDHADLDACDMMHHMGGFVGGPDSPGGGGHDVRPPKMSIASTASFGGVSFRGRGSSMSTYQSVAHANTTQHFETPQIKQDEGWGSRPVPGRDWGSSCVVDSAIIQELEKRLEESCRLAGNYTPFDDTKNVGLPFMPLPCLEVDMNGRPSEGRGSLASMEEVNEEPEALVRDSDANEKLARRRRVSFAKHKRMSLWASAAPNSVAVLPERKSVFFPPKSALSPVEDSPVAASLSNMDTEFPMQGRRSASFEAVGKTLDHAAALHDEGILTSVFGFLSESELMCKASLVCSSWSNAATNAHANMMTASIGYIESREVDDEDGEDDSNDDEKDGRMNSVSLSMARDWRYITKLYPWGCYLSAGAFKSVYKVHNTKVGQVEAVSVMDIEEIHDKKIVAAELVVSVMLSSLSRRGVCPNFVLTRGVFTSAYAPPESHWGCETNKKPKGAVYNARRVVKQPAMPKVAPEMGRYQLIRMELCSGGDLEEYIKAQKDEVLECNLSRSVLFQVAFALHAGADRFSLKHYDMKLLNIFVQKLAVVSGDVVLRYGLGAHVFALRMPCDQAFIAKLADYGTANVRSESNGQPVTIAQFTTFENTPPDFMILGDLAAQGHGHDNWGLGLCMLHLFTGHRPYEEILDDVTCPPMLRKKLKKIWENERETGYTVIRSVILADVIKDDYGHITDGEPDETLYDTLYRYLVLFGVPREKFLDKKRPKVWKAIRDSLQGVGCNKTGRVNRKQGTDVNQYERDCSLYSIHNGSNVYIRRARERLRSMEGGMDLLLLLCSFDPTKRATALQVLNSTFMQALREKPNATYDASNDHVQSFTSFSTNNAN